MIAEFLAMGIRRAIRRARFRIGRLSTALAVFIHPFRASDRLDELTVENAQLLKIVDASGQLRPPPAHLQRRVIGEHVPHFIEGGRAVLDDIERVLAREGLDLGKFNRVLDFGCGCGRVTQHLRARLSEEAEIVATDIDPEAIDWCRQHYGTSARFCVNPDQPPTEFADGHFDFVVSISIFTHLPEELQNAWLRELARIARPGGYLLLTVHGPKHFDKIPNRVRGSFDRDGFAFVRGAGTEGLPAFYQTTFHTHDYIRREWSRYLDILGIFPVAISHHQDAVLCRTPDQNTRALGSAQK